jgi:hypothetical protein
VRTGDFFYTHICICLNTLYEDIRTASGWWYAVVVVVVVVVVDDEPAFPGVLHDQGMLWHMRSHLHSLTLPIDMLGFPILEAGAIG